MHFVSFLLLVIGGLNWLLMGVFQWEIGRLFGGSDNIISRIIYVLVGLAAIYQLLTYKKSYTKSAGKKGMSVPMNPPQNQG